jgi:hypothetical protein
MQDASSPSPAGQRISNGMIWRLAQIVLVLAAMYLYFLLGSYGVSLWESRLTLMPHTSLLIKAILNGLALGLCIGLALKNLGRGQVTIRVDWPTIIINALGAGLFAAIAIGFNVAAVQDTRFIQSHLKDAVSLSPLVPFVWLGLTITTIVQTRSEEAA